jgi:hypothetical protein
VRDAIVWCAATLVEDERAYPKEQFVARERLLQEVIVLAGFARKLLWLDGTPAWWPSGKGALLCLQLSTIAVGLCLLGVAVVATGASFITFHWSIGADVNQTLLVVGAVLFVLGTLLSVATLFVAVIRLLVFGS